MPANTPTSRFLLLLLLLLPLCLHARNYGNEWIDYKANYVKLSLTQAGLYQVTGAELEAAGVDLNRWKPGDLKLFHLGTQVPLYVESATTDVIQASDVIEFIALPNNSELDRLLYRNPQLQANPYQAFIQDSSAYYLTSISGGTSIQLSSVQTSAPAASTNRLVEKVISYRNEVSKSIPLNAKDKIFSPEYDACFGWGSSNFSTSFTSSFTVEAGSISGAEAAVGFSFCSVNDLVTAFSDRKVKVNLVSGASNRLLLDTIYDGWTQIQKTYKLQPGDINGTKVNLQFTVEAAPGGTPLNTVNYARLQYYNSSSPAQADEVILGSSVSSFSTSTNGVVYDLDNVHRVTAFSSGGKFHYNLQPTQHYLIAPASPLTVPAIKRVEFRLPKPDNPNYLIISHPALEPALSDFISYKLLGDPTGPYSLELGLTPDIYEQFGYGVHHPAALQNYIHFIYDQAPEALQYVLLCGKGYGVEEIGKNPSLVATDYVPTLGYPRSDALFVLGIDKDFEGFSSTLPVSFGRIPAWNAQELDNYLVKLKTYYATGIDLWQKDVVHATHGTGPSEQLQNKSVLDNLRPLIIQPYIGGKVINYHSIGTDAIDPGAAAVLQGIFNKGIGMYTFLGHGSAEYPAVSIGEASTLNNAGRYMVMYMNGCEIGDVGLATPAKAHDWMMAYNDRGSIGWLAHSSKTYLGILQQQINYFYRSISQDSFHGGVGDGVREMFQLLNSEGLMQSPYARGIALELTLQGDPSLKMAMHRTTDYQVSANRIYLKPDNVLTTQDTMQVAFVVRNPGSAVPSTLLVELTHTSGTATRKYSKRFNPIYYSDTLVFDFPVSRADVGINTFKIHVDPQNEIPELDDSLNNIATALLPIQGTGARLLAPANFGLVSTTQPELKVQSRDLNDNQRSVLFELDTLSDFSSPYLKSSKVEGIQPIIWQPQLLNKDSQVYYWRASLDLPSDSGGEWFNRSFTYISHAQLGWSQSDTGQYSASTSFDSMTFNPDDKSFEFDLKEVTWRIQAHPHTHSNVDIKEGDLGLTGGVDRGKVTLLLVLVDQNTLQYNQVGPIRMDFPDRSCGHRSYKAFNMRKATTDGTEGSCANWNGWGTIDKVMGRDSFVWWVNRIPEGAYAIMSSRTDDQGIDQWEPEVFEAFHKLGITLFDTVQQKFIAFALAGRKFEKGGEALLQAHIVDSAGYTEGEKLDTTVTLFGGPKTTGNMLSGLIGPALNWKSAHLHVKGDVKAESDSTWFDIIGITPSSQEVTLYKGITADSFSLVDVDAIEYPHLRMKAYFRDSIWFTPPKFIDWTVQYFSAPEGTIVLDEDSYLRKDTSEQGELVEYSVKFKNISNQSFVKPLRIFYYVLDASNDTTYTYEEYLVAPEPGASIIRKERLATTNLSGAHRLYVSFNHGNDQPEQELSNNLASFNFFIITDLEKPQLEVTIEGRLLENRALVPAQPEIQIRLTDDNELYTPLVREHLKINLIQLAAGDTLRPDYLESNFDVEHSLDHTELKLTWQPLLQSGFYKLMVTGVDAKDNRIAGDQYEVIFQVQTEAALLDAILYPNPSPGRSTLKFNLTGSEVPDQLLFDLVNIDGRLIRTIDLTNIAALQIGENRVPLDFSDLSIGMYFYKITASRIGEPVDVVLSPTLLYEHGKLIINDKVY